MSFKILLTSPLTNESTAITTEAPMPYISAKTKAIMSEEQLNSISKDGLTTLMIDVDHQCVKCHNAIELLRKMPHSSPHEHPGWTFKLIPSWTNNEHTGHTGFTHYHIEIIVPTIKDTEERYGR